MMSRVLPPCLRDGSDLNNGYVNSRLDRIIGSYGQFELWTQHKNTVTWRNLHLRTLANQEDRADVNASFVWQDPPPNRWLVKVWAGVHKLYTGYHKNNKRISLNNKDALQLIYYFIININAHNYMMQSRHHWCLMTFYGCYKLNIYFLYI